MPISIKKAYYEDWYEKLHKSTLTEALLDRIVHNRIDINMGTDNFRIK